MPSNFPAGTDNFNIPNSPGSTALSSAGTGSRNHVQHHRDLGDAIEAMQAEATLLVHSHNSSTARHGNKLLQANTHQSPDTDVAVGSLHHTLGVGALQAAPANHAGLPEFASTHTQVQPRPVNSIFMTTVAGNPSGAPHNLGGTWVQITDVFLIGAGGSFTAGTTGGVSTHTHSAPTVETKLDHTHSLGSTSVAGAHAHSLGATGATNPTHSHAAGGPSNTFTAYTDVLGFYGSTGGHTHSFVGQDSSNHAHGMGGTNTQPDHSHTFSSSGSGGSHTHTMTPSTPSHLPPWLAVYTWKRTA